MEIRNHTPFPVLAFQGLTPENETFHVVVLRQSFTFAGGAPVLADEQSPLCVADAFHGAANQSSVAAESDLCPFKPRCDILVNATAHPPWGTPVRSFPVRLRVEDANPASGLEPLVDKTLLVTGPSRFRRRSGPVRLLWWAVKWATLGLVRRNPWKQTRCSRILELPIRYEHAFGGEAKVLITDPAARRVRHRQWLPGVTREALEAAHAATGEAGALAWAVFAANPVGKGFAPGWWLRAGRAEALPAPQILAPDAPFTAAHLFRAARGKLKPGDGPAFQPQGFGIVAKGWAPRSELLGTVDEAFARSDRGLPGDFRFGYWNAAPPDQQVPGLKGDEIITLTNLCPPGTPGAGEDVQGNTVLRLALPGHQPLLLVRYADGRMMPTALELDTVSVDLEQASLVLVWRSALPLEPRIRKVEAMMLDREEPAQADAFRQCLRRGLDGGGVPARIPAANGVAHA